MAFISIMRTSTGVKCIFLFKENSDNLTRYLQSIYIMPMLICVKILEKVQLFFFVIDKLV